MNDFYIKLSAADSAIDMLERYLAELDDVRAGTAFALASVADAARRQCELCESRLQDLPPESDEARAMQQQLEALSEQSASYEFTCGALLHEWDTLAAACREDCREAIHAIGLYIRKLTRITARQYGGVLPAYTGSGAPPAAVCVADSRRHPQTAEHIRCAMDLGVPAVLTLDRANAAKRRASALAKTPANSFFDRDEFPCAMFAEGGSGSDVALIDRRDNRGCGSYMSWQLRYMPDHTRVRIRVI